MLSMRIGIFGGSFNPVHLEHYYLAKEAITSLSLDKLIIMPAHTPPHKKGKILASNEDRLEMCRLAYADLDKAEVSDYEIRKGGVSYTYQTCAYFKSLYPNATLFWLVGTDMLRDFPAWRNPRGILEMVTLAVCARNEKSDWLEREKKVFYEHFQKEFALINYHGKAISSTKVRVYASAGEEISAIVGDKVAEYIQKKGLYLVENAKQALALEKPSRKAHTLRVAEMAVARANSLGVSEQTAITASLFHDCAKNLDLNSSLLKDFSAIQGVPAPVVHQFTGAYLAEKVFGIQDSDILNAIRFHTSGRANMSVLERLIFLSDMLEEERDFEGIDKLRTLFWDKSDDLSACMAVALAHCLEYLQKKGGEIYALTAEAERYYREK